MLKLSTSRWISTSCSKTIRERHGRFYIVLYIQPPDSLYKRLQKIAEQDGVSLDQFVVLAVAEKISALTTEGYLRERASRGSRSKYENVLDKRLYEKVHDVSN